MAGDITLEGSMATYLTRRCIWLHVITLLLVSSFLLAAWWQYGAARAGNGLSWAYTFEWPAFAVYAVYMWWKMIHDQRTGFDRLWVARQHAAADRFGTPLHQIPGWATDKSLSKAVIAASHDAPDTPALTMGRAEPYVPPALGDGEHLEWSAQEAALVPVDADLEAYDHPGSVIDAEVIDVKTEVDEDLLAYNRYLAELNRKDVPKQWGLRQHGAGEEASAEEGSPVPAAADAVPRRALPASDRRQS
jgi:hypothetical protein